jgi:hypothetical protein
MFEELKSKNLRLGLVEEFFQVNVGIAKRAFQGKTINLIVVRENYYSAIRMLHFDVAAFSMDLQKSHSPQRDKHLPA